MARTPDQLGDSSLVSDELLMGRVALSDSTALEQLYSRYGRVVYALSLKILANAEQAEDAVQETFWRVWNRGATFQASNGQFAPWLFGIARNLCIDELRRCQVRPTSLLGGADDQLLLAIPDDQPDMDLLTWEAERRRVVVGALNELPVEQRQAIELAYFGGLSQREIAERLNHPLGTVKTRTRLALQKLKAVLQHQGIDLEEC